MATAFMREAVALLSRGTDSTTEEARIQQGLLSFEDADCEEPTGLRRSDTQSLEQQFLKLDRVAGGDYWRSIASGPSSSFRERLDDLVEAYESRMRQWFQLVAGFPIVDAKAPSVPKYWMLLGSRYLPAVELFNRAACKARRDQGVAWNTGDSLFGAMELVPHASERDVDMAIDACAKEYCPMMWKELRWKISAKMIGQFTDAEINRGIKRCLKSGLLRGADPKRVNDLARIVVS